MADSSIQPVPKRQSPGAAKAAPRLRFGRRQRLSHERQFDAVYQAKVRKSSGPITMFLRPNLAGCPRLGLSVGRRVGSAVVRTSVKRRLREAFRQLQHQLPSPPLTDEHADPLRSPWLDPRPAPPGGGAGATPGYDLVVAVSPHKSLKPAEYAALLLSCVNAAHKVWCKRLEGKP